MYMYVCRHTWLDICRLNVLLQQQDSNSTDHVVILQQQQTDRPTGVAQCPMLKLSSGASA